MSDAHFDRYQFDPAMKPGSFENELLAFHQESIFGEQALDPNELNSFDVRSQRRTVRKDSAMFADRELVRLILLAAFPELKENSKQRRQAKRWLKVIRLYWHLGAPVSYVAKAMYGSLDLNLKLKHKRIKVVERVIE